MVYRRSSCVCVYRSKHVLRAKSTSAVILKYTKCWYALSSKEGLKSSAGTSTFCYRPFLSSPISAAKSCWRSRRMSRSLRQVTCACLVLLEVDWYTLCIVRAYRLISVVDCGCVRMWVCWAMYVRIGNILICVHSTVPQWVSREPDTTCLLV